MKTIKLFFNRTFVLGLILTSLAPFSVLASDHDDGVSDSKGQTTNLTDLYVFREDNQTGDPLDAGNLVLIMNSSPRSLPQQQYYFESLATYNFHLTRVPTANKNERPTGTEDIRVSFKFSPPAADNTQAFTMTLTRSGVVTTVSGSAAGTPLLTSPLSRVEDELNLNVMTIDGMEARVYAGMREDPFFFDVQQFFKVRAGAAGLGPKEKFRSSSQASDFAEEYNVNSIVLSLPIKLLQSEGAEPIFDVWETVILDNGTQVDRLARPAINEGLIISNTNLNAFNSIPPSADLSEAAGPVLAEAAASLEAFDMLDNKDDLTVEAVTTAFLPDVMRIDSSLQLDPGKPAYNSDVSGDKGMLTGGRKIKDDVMDITLSFLVAGDATGKSVKDNVSYDGAGGNPAQGHKKLFRQRGDEAEFPFLAKPH